MSLLENISNKCQGFAYFPISCRPTFEYMDHPVSILDWNGRQQLIFHKDFVMNDTGNTFILGTKIPVTACLIFAEHFIPFPNYEVIFNSLAGRCSKKWPAIRLKKQVFLPLPSCRSPATENIKQLLLKLRIRNTLILWCKVLGIM